MSREIDSDVFPCVDRDLDRIRDMLGPILFRCHPEPTARTGEGCGRLVRPTLTLLSYYLLADAASPADERVVRAASAVELLHLGSLYHTDRRRGRPA